MQQSTWLDWIIELQSLAQIGLTYTKDDFDKERFERIRELSAQMMSRIAQRPPEEIKDLFCNETGFQTPKLDTRAAVFRDGKILLVHEKTGKWSLPGGWVDVNQSIRQNTVKEVFEESGYVVDAVKIISIHDRNLHNSPRYAYGVCKIFVLCKLIGGTFRENLETTECKFFSIDELPELAVEKCTDEQISLCFEAYRENGKWEPEFD